MSYGGWLIKLKFVVSQLYLFRSDIDRIIVLVLENGPSITGAGQPQHQIAEITGEQAPELGAHREDQRQDPGHLEEGGNEEQVGTGVDIVRDRVGHIAGAGQ